MAAELVSDGGGIGSRMADPGKDLFSRKSNQKFVNKPKKKKNTHTHTHTTHTHTHKSLLSAPSYVTLSLAHARV